METGSSLKGRLLLNQHKPQHQKRYRVLFLCLSSLLLILIDLIFLRMPGECKPLKIKAETDKTEATVEDQIILTISVSGENDLSSPPQLPSLPNFSVTEGGKSSRTQIINGRFSSSIDYSYILIPRRTGVFTIGPARIKHKGHFYQSQPIQIRILQVKSSNQKPPLAHISQHVDIKSPYVQQQINYTFRFYRMVDAAEANWEPPTFQGFWVENLGKERQHKKVFNGKSYMVTEIKKALFPLSDQAEDIPESLLTCKLIMPRTRTYGRDRSPYDSLFPDSFFSSRGRTINKALHAKAISLDIKQLPKAGRPANFSGLVGTFKIAAEVGETHLRTGDSTTLTVKVSGQGNLRDLVSLSPEAIPGFKIYPDKPNFQLQIENDIVKGTKVFKKALVPLQEGNIEIPAHEITYFDPSQGLYRSAKTTPIMLIIEKGQQTEPLHLVQSPLLKGSKSSIKILGEDILPIHTGLSGARLDMPSNKTFFIYLLFFLIPPCAFLTGYINKRKKERLEADQHIVRRKKARKKASRILQEANKRINQGEDIEFFRQLSRSIKGLIGDKLNISALAYTPDEIYKCLIQKGLKEETVNFAKKILEELEFRQYVATKSDLQERETMYEKAAKLTAQLDKQL